MKKYLIIVSAFILTSCASYHQLMVGPDGSIQDCNATGQGLVGIAVAQSHTNSCAENLMRAGYLKIEDAGVIGIKFFADNSMRILKVEPDSPADRSGIKVNDKVISIDGQVVTTNEDAQSLLFNKAYTRVKLEISSQGITSSHDLTRVPFTTVYSSKK